MNGSNHTDGITFDFLYELERQLKGAIGAKERFVLLYEMRKHLIQRSVHAQYILDVGGCNFTSFLLKKIFPGSYVVSINIDSAENTEADVSIAGDIAEFENIFHQLSIAEFDIIFMGEVFEHLVQPYSILVYLSTILRVNGHLVITTTNLANIYNRFLLLFGRPLYNYRPIGVTPGDDHITVITKHQMLKLLQKELKFEVTAIRGFSYWEPQKGLEAPSVFARSGRRLRLIRAFMNKILPISFKEGIIYIGKKIV